MNFVTLTYLVFLLVVVGLYWALPRRMGRWWLIVASLVFYGSWNPVYVPGFAILLFGNWQLAVVAQRRPAMGITAAVILDIGVLAIFKYSDWVLGASANVFTRISGSPAPIGPVGIILPLAISFITFTMLAYVIDVARGYPTERRLDRFALFVTFFPHLIAGPIMRAYEFLPQVRHPRPWSVVHLRLALPLLVGGLLKKVLGDTLAPHVNAIFADPAAFSTISIWTGILAFAFQIYLDFSGYTDLALGSAHLLGFRLPRNFEWPYRAASIQDFWRRWHITLSRWLRDYLYISLGGSRRGPRRAYAALITTMLLGGLWHGAGLTFVLWGAWHGMGLAVHRWLRRDRRVVRAIPVPVAWALTFGFVLVGWVFFRAASVGEALLVLRQAFTWTTGGNMLPASVAVLCLVLLLGQWHGWTDLFSRVAPPGTLRRHAAYGVATASAVLL
ncbi:MAG: MBOAT family protein, partial [Chloroflexota bacterium]|nr:MBOAT family protein [Chloroflexota bacterium]